jgi:hypothetical protein
MGNCFSVRTEFETKAIPFLINHGIKKPLGFLKKLKSAPFGYEKLNRLMEGDVTKVKIDGEENYFDVCFDDFTKQAPQWSRAQAAEYSDVFHTFFDDFNSEDRRKILIIRRQIGGICYLHAVVTFEHYLSALLSQGEITTTIDVGKYGGFALHGRELRQFLLRNEGGNAIDTLCTLVNLDPTQDLITYSIPNTKAAAKLYADTCNNILMRARAQPALVSNMKIADIYGSTDVVFTEAPRGLPGRPRHSLVLIGARKGKDGEYYFLLQNWWESRYFIEVSGQYLSQCDARISFFLGERIERHEVIADFLYQATFAETCADVQELPTPDD